MSKIIVFFVDDHKAVFDRDKVSFTDHNGTFFTLSGDYQGEEQYARLLDDGRALVNYSNVCFIREYEELPEGEKYSE